MDLTITVRGCDQCKRNDRPATRYTLTPENSEPVTRDLCAEDVAPLEALFGPLVPAEEPSPQDAIKEQLLTLMVSHEKDTQAHRARVEAEARTAATPAKKAVAKKAPAKKAAVKKTAAKKTTARKTGTKSLTVDEINAKKARGEL